MRTPIFLALSLGLAAAAHAGDDPVRVAIHVDSDDRGVLNLVIQNVTNIRNHYRAQGQAVEIQVVANGPGLTLFRPDRTPFPDTMSLMTFEMDDVAFVACAITIEGVELAEGAPVELYEDVLLTPSGVVRLTELQRAGWAYLKP